MFSLIDPIQAKNDVNDARILYRTLIWDPLGPNMCAYVGLEAYECILELLEKQAIQWTRCMFSLIDPFQAKNVDNDARILCRTLLCDPSGPNMCADVGLEADQCILGLGCGLDVYCHCLTLVRPRATTMTLLSFLLLSNTIRDSSVPNMSAKVGLKAQPLLNLNDNDTFHFIFFYFSQRIVEVYNIYLHEVSGRECGWTRLALFR